MLVVMKEMKQLQEIDLSKLNLDGPSDQCYKEIADMILRNRALKTLNMQKVSATD